MHSVRAVGFRRILATGHQAVRKSMLHTQLSSRNSRRRVLRLPGGELPILMLVCRYFLLTPCWIDEVLQLKDMLLHLFQNTRVAACAIRDIKRGRIVIPYLIQHPHWDFDYQRCRIG